MKPRSLAVGHALAFLAFVLAHSLGNAAELRQIMRLGDPAPGFEAGARLEQIGDAPRIDAAGTVSLVVFVRRPTGERTQALYRVAGTAPELLFKAGDAAPGSGELRFAGFPFFPATPRIDGGRVTFVAEVEPASRTEQLEGIWSDRFGSFDRLFLLGDPLPNPPAGAEELVGFGMTTRGTTALLRGQFARGSQILRDDEGIWRNVAAQWQSVIVKGQSAPGLPGTVFDGGLLLGTIFFFTARDDGRVLVQAWVAGSGVSEDNDEGLWVETATGLELLAREGTVVRVPTSASSGQKGKKSGTRRATFGPSGSDSGIPTFGSDNENLVPAINDHGNVVFGAVLRFGKERSGSVWTNRSGRLELIALSSLPLVGSGPGTQAPGFPSGVNFAAFIISRINTTGRIAFLGFADGFGSINNLTEGLWWDVPGSLQLVAAEGKPLASLPGATVADIQLVDRLTDEGSLFFEARLAGSGIDASNDRAVFRASSTGVVSLLRTGDSVLTSEGTRIVRSFDWGIGGTAGGEGVATVGFTDGTAGVFAFPTR